MARPTVGNDNDTKDRKVVLVHREVGTGNPRSSRTAKKSWHPPVRFPINLASKFLQLHSADNTALEELFDLSRDRLSVEIRASIQSVQCGVYGLLISSLLGQKLGPDQAMKN